MRSKALTHLVLYFRISQDKVFAVRKDSPLIIGVGQGENFIASDVTAVLKYTKDYYLLEQDEIVAISPAQVGNYRYPWMQD